MMNNRTYVVRGKQWKLVSVKNALWKDHKIPCTIAAGELRVTVRDNTEMDYLVIYCRQMKLQYHQI